VKRTTYFHASRLIICNRLHIICVQKQGNDSNVLKYGEKIISENMAYGLQTELKQCSFLDFIGNNTLGLGWY